MRLVSIQDFAAATDQGFDLSVGEASMALTLVKVESLAGRPVAGQMRQPFSLLFRSASHLILPQRIYHLSNAVLGALDMFLVPVARDREGIVYQAVYN